MGPGQYHFPSQSIGQQVVSNKKSAPSFTIKSRTRLPYYPQCVTEFQGRDSPPCVKYSPEQGLSMVKAQIPRFSVGRSPRFEILSHNEATLTSMLPLTYAPSIVEPRRNKYKQVS